MNESDKRSQELIRGEELFSQGFLEEAKKCFLKLVTGPDPSKEALNNLGVLAYQENNVNEAVRYFTESLHIDPLYEDAMANYSELLDAIKRAKSGTGATETEPPSSGRTPGHQTPDFAEAPSLRGRRVRIAVLCLPGLETFLGDIVKFLQSRYYEVRTCYSSDGAALKSAVHWADLIWLEWANQLAEALTHQEGLLDGKRVICRVHSYEVLDGYLPRVNWSKITKTIFVAPHVLDIARRIHPRMMDVTSAAVIPNGVDLDKFSFKERAPGFTLAVVGHVNNKKNPSLWPEIMYRLVQIDDRYRIKIFGAMQEVRYGLYLDHAFKRLGLEKHVQLFGHVENIAKRLESENVNYLLTTSIFESFGYGIAEAMAMGYRPLINYFPGADGLWPAACLFSSVDDLLRLIRDDGAYKSLEYRHFVEERYSLPQQMTKIEELINSVMGSDCSSKSVSQAIQKENISESSHGLAEGKNETEYEKPLVTVGIINFNYEKYLDKAIASVLNQHYENIELLIVDDCSTDGSIDKIKGYESKNKNIRGIYHTQNSGSAILAFRDVIKNAKGEYLAYLSADDYFYDHEVIANYINEFINDKTLDYVYGNIQIVDNEGEDKGVWTYKNYTDNEIVYNTFRNMGSGVIPLTTGMFKLDFYQRNKLTFIDDPDNRVAGDTLNTLAYVQYGWKRKYIDLKVISYRHHNDNMTYDMKSRIKSIISVMEYAVGNYAVEVLFPEIEWEKYDGKIKQALRMYLIGQYYLETLKAYYKMQIKIFDNDMAFDKEQMKEYVQPLVVVIEKYLDKSAEISDVFSEKIRNSKTQLDSIKILSGEMNVTAKKNELYHEGQKLRSNLLREYKDKYSHKPLQILIYAPDNGAWKYGFMSWQKLFKYMGVTATIVYDMKDDLSGREYDIFINIADRSYLEGIKNNKNIENIPHKIGLVSKQGFFTTNECTEGDLLNIASIKDFKYDFLISSFSVDSIHCSLKQWIENGIRIESIPFGFNPLIYYPENSGEIYDYFFVGTNSHLKIEETRQYLLPIVDNYSGILRGTDWNEVIPELHPDNSRFFYNRAKINLNYHLPSQKVLENEINERTFVISACGGFQLVDNPKILGKFYSENEMAIARDGKEYIDKFQYYLNKPDERHAMGFNALIKTYENKCSLFHRLENIIGKIL